MIIFDMAGTTIDEDNLVYKTVQKALNTYHCPADLLTVLSFAAGKEKREAIHDTYVAVMGHAPDDALLDQMHAFFREQLGIAYEENPMQLFPGVNQILAELKDRQVIRVFNTGYTKEVAEKILTKVGVTVGEDIDALITADMVEHSRPAPDMIHLAMQQFSCQAGEVVKIGDSMVDIQEGQEAGVKFSVGITTGAQQRAELAQANPAFIIDHMDELLPQIAIHE
ncbi:MAG: HAD hydrolase-like protein [Saprospiraceae bacterium]